MIGHLLWRLEGIVFSWQPQSNSSLSWPLALLEMDF